MEARDIMKEIDAEYFNQIFPTRENIEFDVKTGDYVELSMYHSLTEKQFVTFRGIVCFIERKKSLNFNITIAFHMYEMTYIYNVKILSPLVRHFKLVEATPDRIHLPKNRLRKLCKWGIVPSEALQQPLTLNTVDKAQKFLRNSGSERAAERKARKISKYMDEVSSQSYDLKDSLSSKYRLNKLNLEISDRNNYLDQIIEKLNNILKHDKSLTAIKKAKINKLIKYYDNFDMIYNYFNADFLGMDILKLVYFIEIFKLKLDYDFDRLPNVVELNSYINDNLAVIEEEIQMETFDEYGNRNDKPHLHEMRKIARQVDKLQLIKYNSIIFDLTTNIMYDYLQEIDQTEMKLTEFRERIMAKRVNLKILNTKSIINKQVFQ